MNTDFTQEDRLGVRTLATLAIDAIEKSKSGHPGLPMGSASMAYVLWTRFLKHDPADPNWADRDRFVLSAGHGSMLLYSLLHLFGYDLSLEDIKNFRQWESITPGHPEFGVTPGVECTTGPLGQGFANAVGMALAERHLAARFNAEDRSVVDHYTYILAGDGDLMEGINHEAASLAGHLKLGKLICLYDDNRISIEGSTDIAFTEDRIGRFSAYGWHTQSVADGEDLEAIEAAIKAAKAETGKPSLIAVRTHIGYGSPNKQDSPSAHGEPLGPDEAILTKKNLGWEFEETFHIPTEVPKRIAQWTIQGKEDRSTWNEALNAFDQTDAALAAEFKRCLAGELPAGWDADLPSFSVDSKAVATRAISGKALNAIAAKVSNLIGGSADLAPSNKTLLADSGDLQAGAYGERNIRFGVREHAMGALANGMAYHGGLIPYIGTFFVFSDYLKPAIRMSAITGLKVIYVFTHDSIGVGEDGPTHQPIEHLAALRAVPGLTVIRPADANETVQAWKAAMQLPGPVVLVLTRQGLPVLDPDAVSALTKGAYIIKDARNNDPELILIGTGSEVSLIIEAEKILAAEGHKVRIVSMPSWELFSSQPQAYIDKVLPPEVTARIAVEAAASFGWERWVGSAGRIIGLDRFGASAPASILFKEFGFTAERIVEEALSLLDK